MARSRIPRPRRRRLCDRRLFYEALEPRILFDVAGGQPSQDLFTVRQNSGAAVLDVLGNDVFSDDYAGERRITSVSTGDQGGRISIAADGQSIHYTPPADFAGQETFVYFVDNQLSAEAKVEIASPLADDQYTFHPDGQTKLLDVLANDPFWDDYEGPGKITLVSTTRMGAELAISADGGSLLYTSSPELLDENQQGDDVNDSFAYIVDDLYSAQVKIVLSTPLSSDEYRDIVQHSENNVLDVLANDPFWEGYTGAREITFVSQPESGGAATIADDGKSVLYTPAADFAGYQRFTYVVDGAHEVSVRVQVHRAARDDEFEVDINTSDFTLNLAGNDTIRFTDGSGNRIFIDVVDRITWVGKTEHGGNVVITEDGQGVRYTAPAGFEGTDTFEYLADGVHRAAVEVRITRPVRNDWLDVFEDTPDNVLQVQANDFRGNGYGGDQLITSVGESTAGAQITIAGDGRSLLYTPAPGFRGHDMFTYTVDGGLDATVQVDVRSIVSDDYFWLDPEALQDQYEFHVLAEDHFGPNYHGPAVITSVGPTLNGGVATIAPDGKSVFFIPAEGGRDQFTYTVDDKYEATARIAFGNWLKNDRFVTEQNSEARSIHVLSNDFQPRHRSNWESPDFYEGSRVITSVGPTENGGVVVIEGSTISYTPAPDYNGTDSFTYTVAGVMQATVHVQVIRRVRDDVFHVDSDSGANGLSVLINDLFGADYAGPRQVTGITATSGGGTAVASDDRQSIVYTPQAGFSGRDTFTYTVDGNLKAEVVVWVGESADDILPGFGSLDEFKQTLLQQALDRYDHLFGQSLSSIQEYPAVFGASIDYDTLATGLAFTLANMADSAARSHSETNVQVDGVDEGDILETDGDYLFVLSGGDLFIASAWPADQLAVVSRTAIRGAPLAMYLDGDRLTVISRTSPLHVHRMPVFTSEVTLSFGGELAGIDITTNQEGEFVAEASIADAAIDFNHWGEKYPKPQIWVTVYDVANRAEPQIVEQTSMDGVYVESRRIDGSVFVVLRNDRVDLQLPAPLVEQQGDDEVYETRERYIERMQAEIESIIQERLPQRKTLNANGNVVQEGLLIASEDLFQPTAPGDDSLIAIASFNARDDEAGLVDSTGVFTSGASEIYGALERLYVFDKVRTAEDRETTSILMFDWSAEDGTVALAAKGQVAGAMVDQFSADVHDGYLRIATTMSNSFSGNWSGRSENALFVLHDDGGVLEFVGGMKNLALDETIRSVRFMGERAFVTTFRDVDPLLAVDLSDPFQPAAGGHVAIPGFNSYMQLIDENHILTIGRNTPATGVGPTQISLFDVSDLAQPRMIDQYTFASFSKSEAEADHHAFGWYAEHGVLAVPAARARYERTDEDGDGFRETRKFVRDDELFLFRIDVLADRQSGEGIQLAGQVAHDSPVRRSAFIDDVLYSVAAKSIQAVSIVDPTIQFSQIDLALADDSPNAPIAIAPHEKREQWGPAELPPALSIVDPQPPALQARQESPAESQPTEAPPTVDPPGDNSTQQHSSSEMPPPAAPHHNPNSSESVPETTPRKASQSATPQQYAPTGEQASSRAPRTSTVRDADFVSAADLLFLNERSSPFETESEVSGVDIAEIHRSRSALGTQGDEINAGRFAALLAVHGALFDLVLQDTAFNSSAYGLARHSSLDRDELADLFDDAHDPNNPWNELLNFDVGEAARV